MVEGAQMGIEILGIKAWDEYSLCNERQENQKQEQEEEGSMATEGRGPCSFILVIFRASR